MFRLVNDIEAYPQYMPGCTGAQIMDSGENWLSARLKLSRFGLTQSFSTRNTLSEPSSMTMELIEGPFRSLRGEWQFIALNEQACKVVFWLEFEVGNALAALALPKMMEHVASEQVDALCKRARHIYKQP